MSQNNTHPYVDPQDGEKLVAMVNACMCESVFDSGISLSLLYMHREPAVGHIAVMVYLSTVYMKIYYQTLCIYVEIIIVTVTIFSFISRCFAR